MSTVTLDLPKYGLTEIPRMPPKAADAALKWIDALEGGAFAQTTGMLYRERRSLATLDQPGYCCLGVLSYVCGGKEFLEGAEDNDLESIDVLSFVPSSITASQHALIKWLDTLVQGAEVKHPEKLREVFAGINDTRNVGFAQIAQTLRACLPEEVV